MGVSGPGSGGRWPTAGAVMVCDDMARNGKGKERGTKAEVLSLSEAGR